MRTRRWRHKAGLSPEIIAELKAGKRPSNMAEDEAVVYDFVTELTTTQKVSAMRPMRGPRRCSTTSRSST